MEMAVSRESPIGSAPRWMLSWLSMLLLLSLLVGPQLAAASERPLGWPSIESGQLESAAGSGSGGDPWPASNELTGKQQQLVYLLRPSSFINWNLDQQQPTEGRFRRTLPLGRALGGPQIMVPAGGFQLDLDSILATDEASNVLDSGRLGRAYKPKIMSTARGFGKRQAP